MAIIFRRYFAPLAAEVGHTDEAFKWLEEGSKERNDYLLFLDVSPEFKAMKDDERFQLLIDKIGLS